MLNATPQKLLQDFQNVSRFPHWDIYVSIKDILADSDLKLCNAYFNELGALKPRMCSQTENTIQKSVAK